MKADRPQEAACQIPGATAPELVDFGSRKKDPAKQQKLLELEDQKSKVQFALPLAIMVFEVYDVGNSFQKYIPGTEFFYTP